jgi:nucleoside permease NupC
MTLSEVHVVMTGGYATIAGSLLGAYISFGVGGAVPLLSHAKALKPGIVGALHAF